MRPMRPPSSRSNGSWGSRQAAPSPSPRRGRRQFEIEDEPAALATPDAVIPPLRAVERAAPPPRPGPDPCDICAPPQIPAAAPLPPPLTEAAPAFSSDDVRAVQTAFLEHC